MTGRNSDGKGMTITERILVRLFIRLSQLRVLRACAARKSGQFNAEMQRSQSLKVTRLVTSLTGLLVILTSLLAADKLIGIHSARVLSQSMRTSVLLW